MTKKHIRPSRRPTENIALDRIKKTPANLGGLGVSVKVNTPVSKEGGVIC